ncbi:MAG TPA: NADPH-dependent F420 reductase, partial [Methanosphaera sp.]|nr:NADPH-dependent F420 reductase [Methanosphaera sp.]
ELVEKLPGVKCIDCGKLEKARMIEKITPLLIGLNIKYKSHYGGLRITGIDFE